MRARTAHWPPYSNVAARPRPAPANGKTVDFEEEETMIREFREFIMKGNVLDLAVAVIIATAFGAIVTSLVNDIIMPPIGWLLGGVNFNDLYINLSNTSYPSLAAAEAAGAPVIKYGAFIQTIINFLIIAWVIFLIVKAANRMRKPAEAPAAEPTNEELLLTDIRDLLRAQQR
jgi:large conductance mechanosensitive channel